jgi:hypothetical protein
MSQYEPTQVPENKISDSQWKDLYKIAAISALSRVALIPLQIVVYILWQIPETANESFRLFQENKLYGLLSLELLYLVSNVLCVSVYLAFFVVLHRINRSIMAIATVLGFISIAIIFAARPTFDMLYLSNQYNLAATEAQRAIILAAGEAKLALIYGTAQQTHYVLGSAALLLISIVMLRSDTFSKVTAYTGIIANTLVFGLYVPTIGVYLSIISVFPFLMVWLILIARQFLWLGRLENQSFSITAYPYPQVNK